MKEEHRGECSNYCYKQNDILLGGQCFSMEDYIKKSMVDCNGSCGTDL